MTPQDGGNMTEQAPAWRRVLVTGGSGFTGINLVRYLLSKGVKVRSLDLAEFSYEDCKDQIEIHTGDIRDPEAVNKAMDGVDLGIHTAMALPLYPHDDIVTTGIDGTRLLLQTAKEHGVGRFVHISSTAVYGRLSSQARRRLLGPLGPENQPLACFRPRRWSRRRLDLPMRSRR